MFPVAEPLQWVQWQLPVCKTTKALQCPEGRAEFSAPFPEGKVPGQLEATWLGAAGVCPPLAVAAAGRGWTPRPWCRAAEGIIGACRSALLGLAWLSYTLPNPHACILYAFLCFIAPTRAGVQLKSNAQLLPGDFSSTAFRAKTDLRAAVAPAATWKVSDSPAKTLGSPP